MPLLNFKTNQSASDPKSFNQSLTASPSSKITTIQLKEITTKPSNSSDTGHRQYPSSSAGTTSYFNDQVSSDDDDDVEVVYYTKLQNDWTPQNTTTPPTNDNVSTTPLYSVTTPDVIFNWTVCVFVVLGLVIDWVLVFFYYYYYTGQYWGSTLTALFVIIGGMLLLKLFWGIDQDQLARIYEYPGAVRVAVNSFPWLFTVITSYESASTSYTTRYKNPVALHQHVKLQELSRDLLRVQTLAQSAPLAVLQLVMLLEDLGGGGDVGVWKGSLIITSITTHLTLMMIANLPLKSDNCYNNTDNESNNNNNNSMPRAAYSPYSRLFVGLRMISNFASRTMALSLFISSFRCLSSSNMLFNNTEEVPEQQQQRLTLLPHLIPLLILLLPRMLFTSFHYIKSWIHYYSKQRSNNTNNRPSLLDSLVVHVVASVFFPFGDVKWLYYYITFETTVLIVFSFVLVEVVDVGEAYYCLRLLKGVSGAVYFGLFVLLFVVVPWVVPLVRLEGRKMIVARRRRNQDSWVDTVEQSA